MNADPKQDSRRARITAVETAVPDASFTQEEVWEIFNAHPGLSEKERVCYRRFLSDSSIQKRHVACEDIRDIFQPSPDHHHARFERHAVRLGTAALRRACVSAGILPEQLDGLIVTTCTGYLCPGLSSYLAEELSLRPDICAQDLVGHGCGAAIPALRSAGQMLRDPQIRQVAVVSVEICTAAIYWGPSMDLILSNAIFADGAAAAIVTADPQRGGVALDDFASVLWPRYRDELRFTHKHGRLCNVISKEVPRIVGEAVAELSARLRPSAPGPCRYAFHTGGRRILDEAAAWLGLSEADMAPSRQVLRDYGNMSSPSVFFVLNALMNRPDIRTGEPVMMFTFGAGFTAYGASGQWINGTRENNHVRASFHQDETFAYS